MVSARPGASAMWKPTQSQPNAANGSGASNCCRSDVLGTADMAMILSRSCSSRTSSGNHLRSMR